MSLKNRKNLVNCDKIIALTRFTSILEGDISSNLISHLEGLTAVQLAGLKYPSEVHLALSEQEGREQHKMAGRQKLHTSQANLSHGFEGLLRVESKHKKLDII